MSTLSFDEYSRKKGTIETVTSSNAKLPRARVEVAHPYLALMGLYCGGFAGMYSETALNIALPQLPSLSASTCLSRNGSWWAICS